MSPRRILVCIHDPILDPTTNIESFPEFDTRVQTHIINGKSFTGHFIRDFTSHEIQQLTVKQRYPETRSTAHDSLLRVPSFSDVLNLVKMEYERSGRPVGIFAELKHPSWYNEGKAEHFMEDLFTQQLTDSGISTLRSSNMTNLLDFFETPTPLIVECFEPAPLQYLKKTSSLPLVQLLPSEVEQQWLDPSVNNRDLSVLEHIATYAHGIGPHKSFFGDLPYAVAKQLVGDVKRLSLSIHPYTFHTDRAISAERGGFKQAVIGIDRYGNSSNDNSSSSSSNGSSSNCSITNSSISSNISSSSSSHPPLKATCHSIVAEGTAERSGVGDSVGYPPGSGSCIPTQSSSASDKKRTDEMEEEMYFLCCLGTYEMHTYEMRTYEMRTYEMRMRFDHLYLTYLSFRAKPTRAYQGFHCYSFIYLLYLSCFSSKPYGWLVFAIYWCDSLYFHHYD